MIELRMLHGRSIAKSLATARSRAGKLAAQSDLIVPPQVLVRP
jgi:hypothetical protein